MILPSGLSEVVKRFRADNALPYILLALLMLITLLFVLAANAAGAPFWLFAGAAAVTLATVLGLVVFVVVSRPQMLRTERHEAVMRYIDLLGSRDFDETSQRELGDLIEDRRDRPVSRREATKPDEKRGQV